MNPNLIPDEYSADEWDDAFEDPKAGNYRASPCCYVCGYKVSTGNFMDDCALSNLRKYKAGICSASELESLHLFSKKAWWTIFRMILFNQETRTCHISGVARYCGSDPFNVPLNGKDGLLDGPLTARQQKRIITPKFRDPFKKPRPYWKWVGYLIHARCWELLLYHKLGAIAERDLAIVLAALQQRYRENGYQNKICTPEMRLDDPVRTKCVSDAIDLALQQAEKRKLKKKSNQPMDQKIQRGRIYKLPTEVFWMIFNYLPSQTVADMEKALGLYLNNTFWRSRISTEFFYEIEDLADEDLDWKRLCLKLERRLEKSDALAMRRYILKCLDEVLSVIETSANN